MPCTFLTDPHTEHYLPEHHMGTNGTIPHSSALFPTWQFLQPHFWAHLLQVLIFKWVKCCLSALWKLTAATVTTRLNGDLCAEAWTWTVHISKVKSFVTSSWMLHTYSDTWQPNSLIYRMYQKSICQHNDTQILNNNNFLFIWGSL